MVSMKGRSLQKDLKRVRRMAFRHYDRCAVLLRSFHDRRDSISAHLHRGLISKVYSWLLAPFSLWSIDFAGLARFLINCIDSKAQFDDELVLLLQTVDGPPDELTQGVVGAFETEVEAGRYDPLIRRPEKFAELETNLLQDATLASTWGSLKRHHDHQQYQNAKGVIRRRLSQERNYREGWDFDWVDKRKRFYCIFDALCHRWRLYGIQHDRPLLLKITVNPTPHGTMIV